MGMDVTERAKILGHSVETNLKHYTFSLSDDHLDDLTDKINAYQTGHLWSSQILPFKAKKKPTNSEFIRLFLKHYNAEDGT